MGDMHGPIAAFMAQKENRIAYGVWLKDVITKQVMTLTEASIRPVGKPAEWSADYYAGVLDGRYEVLRLIRSLDKLADLVSQAQTDGEATAGYGVEKILSSMGYDDATIKRMLEKVNKLEDSSNG